MAVDMFLKVNGVKGESKDKKHAGEIDILAWSWGVSNSGSAHGGGGVGAGKANVQDISLTKYIDKSSTDLLKSACSGKHFTDAKLTVRKAGGQPLEYLILTLNDVMVTALSTGGSGGEDRLTENVTLTFSKFTVEYTEQDAKGGAGDKPKMSYDVKQNVVA